MGALRDQQDEAAAQHLAAGYALTPEERRKRGLSPDATLKEEAAALGGLKTNASSFRANARKFCRREIIRTRVWEIRREGAALASCTVGSLIVEAEDVRSVAMQRKDLSPAIAAIALKGKLSGVLRDRAEVTGKDGAPLPPMAIGPTIIIAGRPDGPQPNG